MNLKLNIVDRILLFDFIQSSPAFKTGSITTWRALKQVKEVLGFNQKDHDEFGIEETPGADGKGASIRWKNKEAGAENREYLIPDNIYAQIILILQDLDTKKELDERQFALLEKLSGFKPE